jgi:hypothetical protein
VVVAGAGYAAYKHHEKKKQVRFASLVGFFQLEQRTLPRIVKLRRET